MMNRPHHLAPMLNSACIALVYKSAEPIGYSPTGLGIVATQTAKALRAHAIWADAWACASGEQLLERLHHCDRDALERGEYAPTHVVIYAPWIPTALIARMAQEFPNVVFVVTSHSNFGFLAADPHAVKLMRETAELQMTTHNVRAGGNCRRFADSASEVLGVDVEYLPNLMRLGACWSNPQEIDSGRSV